MFAMLGRTGSDSLKTHRYAARIKKGDERWMSVLSHSTVFTKLDSIFVAGLVLGGYAKESHDAQMPPTCRFSRPNYKLGKADGKHDAVVFYE